MLIEFYMDPVCPWCLIGKRRLERALAERPGIAADLRWRHYLLNPTLPPAGMERARYLALKYGDAARAAQVQRMIARTAEREGLALRLDRIVRTPGTLDAHRLIRLADRAGRAAALVEALFAAYLVDGRDIGDTAVLTEIAESVGVDRDAAAIFLASGDDAGAVVAADHAARRLGIQAVPHIVFARRYGISGAQEMKTFLPFLDIADADRPAFGTA